MKLRSRVICGFTLIELLVVVAIIAILASIAMVNFLEAQVRSKVAVVKSDHRVLASALESYFVDNNQYPEDYAEYKIKGGHGQGRLTTPISYISTIPIDPFGGYIDDITAKSIITYTLGTSPNSKPKVWMLTSSGPNRIDETIPAYDYPGYSPMLFDRQIGIYFYLRYDPTNGTVSDGDIIRVSDGPADMQ